MHDKHALDSFRPKKVVRIVVLDDEVGSAPRLVIEERDLGRESSRHVCVHRIACFDQILRHHPHAPPPMNWRC
jgi:hypothetical protein